MLLTLTTIGALAVGYYAGSARTYASLGYGSETYRQIFATLQPCFGLRWTTFYVYKSPLVSFQAWLFHWKKKGDV